MLTAALDLSDLPAMRDGVTAALEGGCARIVSVAAKEGAAEAVRVHRYKDRSGTLTKSIRGEVTFATKGHAEGEIVAKAPYASFVDGGTKAHIIQPRLGRAVEGPLAISQSRRRDRATGVSMLRWADASGVHFARVVHHPGSKPYPYMGTAYLKAEAVMECEAGVLHAEIAQRFGG